MALRGGGRESESGMRGLRGMRGCKGRGSGGKESSIKAWAAARAGESRGGSTTGVYLVCMVSFLCFMSDGKRANGKEKGKKAQGQTDGQREEKRGSFCKIEPTHTRKVIMRSANERHPFLPSPSSLSLPPSSICKDILSDYLKLGIKKALKTVIYTELSTPYT